MDTRARSTPGQRVYNDFVPRQRLDQDGRVETLIIELPGFKKEQLRVQIDKYGKLRITGERQLMDNRWSRFLKEYQVPDDCNASEIRAKFEDGLLQIFLPKLATSAQEPEASDLSMPPPAPDDGKTRAGQELTSQKTILRTADDSPGNGSKQQAASDLSMPPPAPDDGKTRAGQELTSQKTILRTADDSPGNGSKQQAAKAGEQTAASANAQKTEEKEKVPAKESEGAGKPEKDDDRRTETTDAVEKKEAAVAQGDRRTGGLKYETQGTCGGSGSYWRKRTVLRMSVAALILVGMMFYATYKLKNAYTTYRQVED